MWTTVEELTIEVVDRVGDLGLRVRVVEDWILGFQ